MINSDLINQFELLLLSFLAYAIGTLSPGQNILAILSTSISYGKKAAISLAFGIVTGSILWGIISVFGITSLLLQFSSALFILQVCGALYLLYLSYKSFKSSINSDFNILEKNENLTLSKRYIEGLLVQATNPKSSIVWLTVYSIALTEKTSLKILLIVFLGNFLLSFIIHIGYASFFSGNIIRTFLIKNQKTIQLIISFFFIVLACLLLLKKIRVP